MEHCSLTCLNMNSRHNKQVRSAFGHGKEPCMVSECEICVKYVSLILKQWFPQHYLLWQKLTHCLVCNIWQNSFEQTKSSMCFLNVTRHKARWFSRLLLKVLHACVSSSSTAPMHLSMPTHLSVWVYYGGPCESHLKGKTTFFFRIHFQMF